MGQICISVHRFNVLLRGSACSITQSTLSKTDTLEKWLSSRESTKRSKERQRPTLGVHFTKVFVI